MCARVCKTYSSPWLLHSPFAGEQLFGFSSWLWWLFSFISLSFRLNIPMNSSPSQTKFEDIISSNELLFPTSHSMFSGFLFCKLVWAEMKGETYSPISFAQEQGIIGNVFNGLSTFPSTSTSARFLTNGHQTVL